MKTLKELNSKWYWRLIKIIFFTFIWLITLWVWYITFSYSFEERERSYSPENIKKLDKNVSEIKEYMDILNKIYPDKEVKYIEINKFGEKESLIREIRYLLAMDKNIEGLKPYFPQDDYNEVSCWNGLENYLNDEKWVMMKEIYLVGGCWIKELKEGLNKIKNYKLWSFDESLNEYFADELIYKDYISLPQKVLWTILWILYFIGWLLPLLAFIFLIRSVTYYVVFGKIFPPK